MWLVGTEGFEPITLRILSAFTLPLVYVPIYFPQHSLITVVGVYWLLHTLCVILFDYQSSQFFISKRVKHYGISLISSSCLQLTGT